MLKKDNSISQAETTMIPFRKPVAIATLIAISLLQAVSPGLAQEPVSCDQFRQDVLGDLEKSWESVDDCLAILPELPAVEQIKHVDWLVLETPTFITAENHQRVAQRLAPEPKRKLTSYLMREAANTRTMDVPQAQELLTQAQEKNDTVSQIHLLFAFGVHTARTTGDTDEMERYFRSSLALAEEADLENLLPALYNALAVRAKRDGEADQAIALYNQAIAAYETLGKADRIGAVLTNIGNVFVDLGGYEEAIRFHKASIENYERYRSHDAYRIARAYGNLASAYHAVGRYDDAASAFNQAKALNDIAQSIVISGRLNFGHAETLYALGEVEAAVEMAEAAVPELVDAAHPTDAASALVWLAEHYLSTNDLDNAQLKLEHARLIIEPKDADIREFIERNREAGRSLDYAASMGALLLKLDQPEKAAPYLSIALELSQNRFEQEKVQAAANSELLFDLRDRDASLKRLEDQALVTELQLQRARLTSGLGFAIAAIIGLIAYSTFRSYRMQRTLAQTRDTFLREIHHRTKNNFQIIYSLLNLNSRRAPAQSEGLQPTHSSTANRVRAMALVHDHLYLHGDETSTEVDVKEFLTELLDLLSSSIGSESITLSKSIVSTPIDVDVATPLSLLICELVTNAYKHAFHDKGGNINVRVEMKDNKLWISISDNGCGMDQNEAFAKQGSLGLHLIKDLSMQLGAKFELSSDASGTRWTIRDINPGLNFLN